jgi:hypothetical protein
MIAKQAGFWCHRGYASSGGHAGEAEREEAPGVPKPELEFHSPDSSGWERLNQTGPGVYQKILSRDPEVGNYTRLLKYEAGADMLSDGILTHDHWEEVWIIQGALTDVTLGKTFPAGSYACRPPGMKHGPYKSERGALMFEVRYWLK